MTHRPFVHSSIRLGIGNMNRTHAYICMKGVTPARSRGRQYYPARVARLAIDHIGKVCLSAQNNRSMKRAGIRGTRTISLLWHTRRTARAGGRGRGRGSETCARTSVTRREFDARAINFPQDDDSRYQQPSIGVPRAY